MRPEFTKLFRETPLAAIYSQGVMDQDEHDLDSGSVGSVYMGKGRSERPKQTIWPLVQALSESSSYSLLSDVSQFKADATASVPLFEFLKRDVSTMIKSLGPDFGHKNSNTSKRQSVIISWSHHTLPALAFSLGVPRNEVPAKWNKHRFDVTWILTPVVSDTTMDTATGNVKDHSTPPSPRYTLVQLPQRLLYGDADHVMDIGSGYTGPSLL
jgi:hypothetical protein